MVNSLPISRTGSPSPVPHRARKMARSYSDSHLCSFSIKRIRATTTTTTTTTQQNLKKSRSSSAGLFNFQLSTSALPNSFRSFLFDPETSKEMNIEEKDDSLEVEMKNKKRANWVERLLEIRDRWPKKELIKDDGAGQDCDEECGGCEVDYNDDDEEDDDEGEMRIDSEQFSSLLVRVPWSDAKHFSQLAFLCNLAYAIPEIKAKDLRKYYGLHFVTSSLEKKAKAEESMKKKLDQDSTIAPVLINSPSSAPNESNPETAKNSGVQKRPIRPDVAFEIAASAASYVHSCAKKYLGAETKREGDNNEASNGNEENLKELEEEEEEEEEESSSNNISRRVHKSVLAAEAAASTMTAVVAAGEEEKLEAARDLQSLHSSPCEWFVCDDPSTYTRCFVIQGSDSVASWQANLFFEPVEFEGTEVLVHRGIYEAAKGIYEQFKPEIRKHLNRYGERAKLQFTGHSLGGSLSLLVNLMLLTRMVVKTSALRPVVAFGSPFVFCGGQKILEDLGLDEDCVQCVMMHRDIVPRAFACNYPNYVAQILKRLNGTFRSHPCLNKKKLLYSPMGKIFILQPDEDSSPPHPLLPAGSALYALENKINNTQRGLTNSSSLLRAFLNFPHPLETLSDPTAYGSEGTIRRDHDSSNYLEALNGVLRLQHRERSFKKTSTEKQMISSSNSPFWPLLTSQSPHSWSYEHNNLQNNRLITKELTTGV